jgi:hypothetical protein
MNHTILPFGMNQRKFEKILRVAECQFVILKNNDRVIEKIAA